MTQNKNLKRLVRARALKTGESYAAAFHRRSTERRKQRRWRSSLAALVAVGVVLASCTASKGANKQLPAAPSTASPAPGSHGVGVRNETFVDATRGTPGLGSDVAPQASRTIGVAIYFPTTASPNSATAVGADPLTTAPLPLVVFSPGNNAAGSRYETLLRAWASAGYVVAALTFPLSSGADPRGGLADYENLPGDVSFVIDQLLRLDADAGSPYYQLVDPNHVGIAGQSLGANVTLALASNTCCADARVKAAAILAGAEVAWKGTFFTTAPVPLIVVHGDRDSNIPYTMGQKVYRDARPPKFFVTLIGSDHLAPFIGPANQPDTRVVVATTTAFFDRFLKGDAGAVGRLVDAVRANSISTRLDHVDQ